MLDDLFVSSGTIDWDQFLVKDADFVTGAALDNDSDHSPASAVLGLASQPASPASNSSTPKSTDSEQSQSLDVSSGFGLLDFDFDLPASAGIAHDPSDILDSLATSDVTLSAEPSFSSTFGATLGDFGNLTALSDDTASQLQIGNLLRQLTAPAPAPAPAPTAPGLSEAYAALGWPLSGTAATATPAAESPALSSVSMKRKSSETDAEDSAAKRARGRSSVSTPPVAKRPYRRQSKNGLSLSQLAAAAASGSPLVVDQKLAAVETPKVEPEEKVDVSDVRLTSTGKPSTARPKAVVPEKYMKNGEAQTITGMTTEEILAFPNWESLMECVDEEHRAGAEIFGKMITENRDKAKWAAKKSRDERKAKVETLEGQVDELQTKINGMRGLLLGLVGRGVVSLSEVESFI